MCCIRADMKRDCVVNVNEDPVGTQPHWMKNGAKPIWMFVCDIGQEGHHRSGAVNGPELIVGLGSAVPSGIRYPQAVFEGDSVRGLPAPLNLYAGFGGSQKQVPNDC